QQEQAAIFGEGSSFMTRKEPEKIEPIGNVKNISLDHAKDELLAKMAPLFIKRKKALTTNDNAQQIIDEATEGIPESIQAALPLNLANLEVLSSSDHWFCDGTFKIAPPLFTQLMAINAIKCDAVIPQVYILLPNKTNTTYKRVLEQLKNLKSDLKPTTVMRDFESTLYRAFADIIKRSHDLLAKYTNIGDLDFALNVGKLMSLAFVPPQDVIKSFGDLADS
ncbi:hypothetical protein ILUMI_12322, partial [Ignelater luminosus]